ncbi:MAG: GNAT family N-acetyltransferase [Chthoniobacterales bacterium]
MAITIAPLQADDLIVAVELLEAQLTEHDIASTAEALETVTRAVLANPARGFILLARADGDVVGLAYAAAHLSAEHGGTIGWLEEFYVRPRARGRGAGSALLQAVLDHSRESGWRALELEVVEGHERAIPLYQRHGFERNTRARFTQCL